MALTMRIPTLDGWRGIAILIVVVDHLTTTHHGSLAVKIHAIGLHGVTLFFVLSGFLITRRLMEEHEQTGSISLSSFYVRRFFRLMPTAWIYLIALVLGLSIHFGKLIISRDVLASLLFCRNFSLSANILTQHFWSLSIEEQFYLCWPGILVLLGRRTSAWIAGAAVIFVCLLRLHHWQYLNQFANYYISFRTQYRADALLIGCIGALKRDELKRYLRAWMLTPFLIGFALCIAKYRWLIPLHESVLICGLLLITSEHPTLPISRLLSNRVLAWIGALSYTIYVWQQPVIPIGVLWIAPLAVIAIVNYYLVEKKGIALGRRLEARLRRAHDKAEAELEAERT